MNSSRKTLTRFQPEVGASGIFFIFVHPVGYEPFRSELYSCLYVGSCNGPDLAVTQIHDPVAPVSHVSIVKVTVSNIGREPGGFLYAPGA